MGAFTFTVAYSVWLLSAIPALPIAALAVAAAGGLILVARGMAYGAAAQPKLGQPSRQVHRGAHDGDPPDPTECDSRVGST